MKIESDVIIVGGGVIGCAIAYELAQRSIKVLLIDTSLPGRATSASAGGLWPVGEAIGLGCGVIYHATSGASDESAGSAPEMLPTVFREFLVKSNRMFPDLAQRLQQLSSIDIEYHEGGGLLFLIYDENERSFVERTARAFDTENPIENLSADDLSQLEPHLTKDLLGAARLSGEHQVNPMMLAEGLKRGAISLGADFRHSTRVTGLCRNGNRITGVTVGNDILTCETVINAAGAWAGQLAASAELKLPVIPVRGQIVLTNALPHILTACLSTSGCYLVQKSHGEILIGTTTEKVGFDVSVTTEAITSLCRAAVRAVPMLRSVGVKRIFSGLRPGTPDELPILGPVDGITGYLNATGGFRTGIVASPLTARVVAQCVVGEQPETCLNSYLADRFEGQAAKQMIDEEHRDPQKAL